MNEIEKTALHIAMLTLTVGQLMEQLDHLKCEVQDMKDIFRGCACFGVDDGTEAT